MAVQAMLEQRQNDRKTSGCSTKGNQSGPTESIEVQPLFSASIIADPMTGKSEKLPEALLGLLDSVSASQEV